MKKNLIKKYIKINYFGGVICDLSDVMVLYNYFSDVIVNFS